MYTIQRESRKPIDNINISISLNNENHNLLIQSFYSAYKKNGEVKDNVYIELVKTANQGVRNANDETIIKIELDVNNKQEALKNTRGFVKNIENLINKDMTQSLQEKVKIIEGLLKKYSDRLSQSKNPIYINEDYKEKQVLQSPKNNNNNKKGNNYYNNKGESFLDKFNKIPLAYIIETLAEMNAISLEQEKKPNGDEDFYWIESDNYPKASKVSVLAIRSIENQSGAVIDKYKHCRDLNNNKLSTTTAMSLLFSLQKEGYLKGMEAGEAVSQIIKARGGFKAFPLIDEENETMSMGEGGEVIDIVSLKLPSRLPEIYRARNTDEYKNYLIKERKISSEIIEREFEKGILKTGTFATCQNYINSNIGLFTLKYFQGASKTYEKINFDKVTGKLNRGHLKNIGINGRSHIIQNENTKGTIFTEAVIDNYSMENLMQLSPSNNSEDYNYVGLTSVGNINGWFEHNLNLKVKMKDNKETGVAETQIMYIERKELEYEDQEKELEKVAKAIKTKRLHFVFDKRKPWKEKNSTQSLYRLQKILAKIDPEIEVHLINLDNKNYRIDYNKYDKGDNTKDYILDDTNVKDFFEKNGIIAKYDKETKDYDVKVVQKKEKWNELTDENVEIKNNIKQKIKDLTGNTKFIFSFDNDMAALPKLPHLQNFCEFFGIDYSFTVPTFQNNINDNNDILKTYVELQQCGKSQEASQLLEQFVSQIETNQNKLPYNFEDIKKQSTAIEYTKKKEEGKKKKRSP